MAAGALPRTIGVVGLGLMGASLARAVRAADPSVRIVAVEPRDDVRAQAVAERVADEARAVADAALGACDLVLTREELARIEQAVPAAQVAGTRYGPAQMGMLDSERPAQV